MNVVYHEDKKEPAVIHRFTTEFWEVSICETKSKDLKTETEKLVDTHKDWVSHLNIEFTKMMTLIIRKNGTFHSDEIKFEENLLAIIQKWKELSKLREVSNQKTLSELDAKLGKVKPSQRIPVTPIKKKK